ncbi:MAG: DUF4230 domain-containing protein [Mogibacterium sp.]|nr:DUF4230 domain-containing protein [Mogibacterium sp.]
MKKILAVLILVAVVGAGGYYYFTHRGTQELNADMITARLENASDCTTQKLIYQGLIESESGSIPILNKNAFLMTYTAVVRAGFDISKTDVKVDDTSVVITIPPMEIQEITIQPKSLKFYNTSLTIFKPDEKNEAQKALVAAEKDAAEKAGNSGLLAAADENAEALLRGILEGSVGDREIIINHSN